MDEIDFNSFLKVEMRVGKIFRAEFFPEAVKPAIKLWIDFGIEIGKKKSSAQITEHYTPDKLIGRQIIAIVNFPPRQIGKFMSEVLVLGVKEKSGGIVLLVPELEVDVGERVY